MGGLTRPWDDTQSARHVQSYHCFNPLPISYAVSIGSHRPGGASRMMSSLSIALSGLIASTRQLAASASNIANSRTTGPQAYQPIQTVQQSLAGPGQAGGVIASYQPIDPSTVQEYDP